METQRSASSTEDEGMELPAVVEEKYKKYLIDRKHDIVRHMSNIYKMAQEFLERELLTKREAVKIFQRPLLHQKAEALLDALINSTSFKHVVLVLRIFLHSGNRTASDYFSAIHTEIATTETFNHGLVIGSKEYEKRQKNGVKESDSNFSDRASPEELIHYEDAVYLQMEKFKKGPEINDPVHKPKKNRGAREIIDDAYIYQFEAALKEIQSISDLIDSPKIGGKTSLHYALHNFDEADCHKAAKLILDRFEELVDIDDTLDKISLADFINMKCELTGYTALHMAILYRDIPSVRLFYRNYGADIFIKDATEQTALEMMYLYLPEEMFLILDSSLKSCAKSYLSGKMVIGADFSPVLGVGETRPPGSEDEEDEEEDAGDFSTNDLAFLANVVNTDYKRQKLFLPHPLIALFLLIQWRRYKGWILASAVMQISLKILYAVLVVHVFLHSCRYDPPTTKTPQENETGSNSSAPSVVGRRYYPCEVDMVWKVLAGILAFFGGVLILHEFAELKYKISAVLKTNLDGNIIQKNFSGVKNYIYDLENVIQLLCSTFILYICVKVIRGMFAGFDYAIASVR